MGGAYSYVAAAWAISSYLIVNAVHSSYVGLIAYDSREQSLSGFDAVAAVHFCDVSRHVIA